MSIDEELPPLLDGDLDLPTVLRAGYQVGHRYTLGYPLGRGGYGSLWAAKDEETGEEVAVKVLQAPPRDDDFDVAAARLRREARAYQKLSHPAIARLRNVGTTDQGEPYLVLGFFAARTSRAPSVTTAFSPQWRRCVCSFTSRMRWRRHTTTIWCIAT